MTVIEEIHAAYPALLILWSDTAADTAVRFPTLEAAERWLATWMEAIA